MKHLPFDSAFRKDFEVVEQREGNFRLYPHTSQLPMLARALNFDFYKALPGRIARVDHRADDFHKIILKLTALTFCNLINSSRPDGLRLFPLPTTDLVTKVTIVQQIIEDTPRGACHRFRFYGEDGFFPEIYLCGKRLAFADHVLQRFSSRTQGNVGEDLSNFLVNFFGSFSLAMPVGPGRAFVLPYFDTILAFPYTETETEFFVTTCLTINEIHSLEREMPPQASNLHYGPAFLTPRIRNWVPARCMFNFHKCWERKIALAPPQLSLPKTKWHCFANRVKDFLIAEGHGPGSSIRFLDGIPGPNSLDILPGKPELRHNEMEFYKQAIRNTLLRR